MPWPQNVAGVCERPDDPDRSGLLIHLPIGEKNAAVMGVRAAVLEDQLQRDRRGARQEIHGLGVNLVRDPQVILRADRKVGLDGIDLGDRCEYRCRRDQVTDLDLGDTGDSTDERANFGKTQIQRRLLHCGTARCYGRFRGQLHLRVVLELAAGNGIRLGFRDIAFDVEGGVLELCLCLCELGFRLVEHGLKRARIDLKENVVLVNEGAFAIVLFDQVACDLRLDLRIDIPVQRGNPLAVEADILPGHAGNLYLWGLRGR